MPRKASLVLFLFFQLGCFLDADPEDFPKRNTTDTNVNKCGDRSDFSNAPSLADAMVFNVDPIVSSENPHVPMVSTALNNFRQPAQLIDLRRNGVLLSDLVKVTNGIDCGGDFLSWNDQGDFRFTHEQPGFQEAMTYYYSHGFRKWIDSLNLINEHNVLPVIAHCALMDNAYYYRISNGISTEAEQVCLGDSVASPGMSYADDATVVVHEITHGITANHYSFNFDLGSLWYDEAGALNEALSDITTLIYLEPFLPASFSPLDFSRWALGRFFPGFDYSRGANRCPKYASSYPNCNDFESGIDGFSANDNKIFYNYPDGMGWPFGKNIPGPGYLRNIYLTDVSQEEIHQVSPLMTSILWEAYEASGLSAGQFVQAIFHAIELSPEPSVMGISPVTFRLFGTKMLEAIPIVGGGSNAAQAIKNVFRQRGLIESDISNVRWAKVGNGTAETPGLRIVDHPIKLRNWVSQFGGDPRIITQGNMTGLNQKMDAGEVVALWFDIENDAEDTAGGLSIQVESLSPHASLLGYPYNLGLISNSVVETVYSKINGTRVVSKLSSSNPLLHVPTGNSYFNTNPFFDHSFRTAIWVKIEKSAQPGEMVNFRLKIHPTNGPSSDLIFTGRVNS